MFDSAIPTMPAFTFSAYSQWLGEATAWEQDMGTGMRVCDLLWSVYLLAHAHMSISQASIVTSINLCTQYMRACVYVTWCALCMWICM